MRIVIPTKIVIDKASNLFIVAITSCILLFFQTSLAQNNVVDSLKSELQNSNTDKKFDIYYKIARKFRYSNLDSSLYYNNLAMDYAKESKNKEQEINALLLGATINNSLGNQHLSLSMLNEAKNLCIAESNYELLTTTYLNTALYYNSKFNYYMVISVLDSALTMIDKHNIIKNKPQTLNLISDLYLNINDIQTAKYYANRAFLLLNRIDDIESKIKNLYIKAKIEFITNDDYLSLVYYTEALNISKQSNFRPLIQLSYRRLASYYIDINSYDTATMYIDSSMAVCKEIGFKIEESSLITYKAHIETLKNDYKAALDYNIEALRIRKNTGHKSSISSSLINIGGNYIYLNEFKKAREFIDMGLAIAKEQKILSFISRGYEKLSLLNKLEGNYKEALYYYELKTHYNDSVLLQRTNDKVIFFSNLYEIEKEKRLIDAIKLSKKSNEVLFLIIGTFLSIFIIILLFRFNYVRNRNTKEIVKLSKVIETTDQAVIISDKLGNIQYVNKGLKKMMDLPIKQNLVNTSIFQFARNSGKYLLINTIFPQLQNKGKWNGEIFLEKSNKSKLIAELTCSLIKDQNSKQDLFVAIFSDITKRKKDEVELKESREYLKKAVETQDKIFSIIAHDLIGPFNTILGFSELLAVSFEKYDKKEQLKFSKVIHQSSKNTFDVLTRLLDWSRLQMGKIEIHKEQISILDAINEALQLLKLTYQQKEITIHNNVDPRYLIFADKGTLSIILRNLLSNAIKFTPRNGLIKITAFIGQSNSTITISDNGIGIKQEDLDKLFDISTRNSKSGTENEKGTGLGLMLCKELLELNEGSLSVESTFGLGSSFIISLPNS